MFVSNMATASHTTLSTVAFLYPSLFVLLFLLLLFFLCVFFSDATPTERPVLDTQESEIETEQVLEAKEKIVLC